MPKRQLLILITGPSGSGKSSLAQNLLQALLDHKQQQQHGSISSKIFHQDDYFTQSFLPYKDRTDFSYEDDSCIDWDSMSNHINEWFDCNNKDLDRIAIVEGHMVAAEYQRWTCCTTHNDTVAIVLRCTKQTCLARRLHRRQRTPEEFEELESYIQTYVWPAFETIGRPAMGAMKNQMQQQRGSSVGAHSEFIEICVENKTEEGVMNAVMLASSCLSWTHGLVSKCNTRHTTSAWTVEKPKQQKIATSKLQCTPLHSAQRRGSFWSIIKFWDGTSEVSGNYNSETGWG